MRQIKIALVFPFLSFFLFACVNTKKFNTVFIPKGQAYYKKINTGTVEAPADTLQMYELTKGSKAKIKIPDASNSRVEIEFVEDVSAKSTKVGEQLIGSFSRVPLGIFFPRDDTLISEISKDAKTDKNGYYSSGKFTYWENKQVLQALSIPLKIRPRLNDTVSAVASASFNVGFAYGIKLTKTVYNKYYYSTTGSAPYRLLNHGYKKFSFSPGFFMGPAIVDLKSTNTNGVIKKDRSVAALTTGGYVVVGYNEFNIGFACGMDKTFGPLQGKWIYNGKPWFGVVVALDIIK